MLRRYSLILIVIIVLVAAWVVQAQQSAYLSADAQGVLVQSAPSSALVARNGGRFTLILEHASAVTEASWQQASVMVTDTQFDTRMLARGWREADNLVGFGVLETDQLVVRVRLETPFLNPETEMLSYTAVIDEVLAPSSAQAQGLAQMYTFGETLLYIEVSEAFYASLNAGMELSEANSRDCSARPGLPGFIQEVCESGGL